MKRNFAIAVCAVALVVLPACGSSRPIVAPVAAHYRGAESLTFVATAPSTSLGVDNTDLFSASTSGLVRNVTSTAATETDAAWSADGRDVVFTRHWATSRSVGRIAVHMGVFVWSPGHGNPHQIAACSGWCTQRHFAWSPDGSRIAFATTDANSAIEVMNADGSGIHVICDAKHCGQGLGMPVWSPDGRRLVFSNEGVNGFMGLVRLPSAIWIANADGSGIHKLTQPGCDLAHQKRNGCALDAAPAWSPNGSLLAFSRRPEQFPPYGNHSVGGTELEVMNADGSHLRTLAGCRGNICNQIFQPAWSPNGKAIASTQPGRLTAGNSRSSAAARSRRFGRSGATGAACAASPAAPIRAVSRGSVARHCRDGRRRRKPAARRVHISPARSPSTQTQARRIPS
jgi:Tol biopolymer transport system component